MSREFATDVQHRILQYTEVIYTRIGIDNFHQRYRFENKIRNIINETKITYYIPIIIHKPNFVLFSPFIFYNYY